MGPAPRTRPKTLPVGGCGCSVRAHDRTVRATRATAGMARASRRGDGGRDVAVLPPGGVCLCPTAAASAGCPPAADHRRPRVAVAAVWVAGVGESGWPQLACLVAASGGRGGEAPSCCACGRRAAVLDSGRYCLFRPEVTSVRWTLSLAFPCLPTKPFPLPSSPVGRLRGS